MKDNGTFTRPLSQSELGYNSDQKFRNAGIDIPKTIGGVHRTNRIITNQRMMDEANDDFMGTKIDLKEQRKQNRINKKR